MVHHGCIHHAADHAPAFSGSSLASGPPHAGRHASLFPLTGGVPDSRPRRSCSVARAHTHTRITCITCRQSRDIPCYVYHLHFGLSEACCLLLRVLLYLFDICSSDLYLSTPHTIPCDVTIKSPLARTHVHTCRHTHTHTCSHELV